MEDFRHTYVRLCRENHIETQDTVINQLKSLQHSTKKDKNVLDLSTCSLTSKTCAVLGKILATDRSFLEVKFADCMLSEDAIKGLCHGFSRNVYCRKLDLKGNNIRGPGAESLGKLLRNNKCVLSICLEWNALGMLDNSFARFCEGLAENNVLQALDLRNNQISHDAAAELARALKQNNTLHALDLRWNNVGLLGGRALLEMLQTNKTLTRVELAGNNIPADILKAIDTAISQNEDRALLTDDFRKKTTTLTKHIQQIEETKALQVNELMDTIETQEDLLRKSKRSTNQKISQLQETLEERKSAFNSLAAKLAMTESELALAEQKNNDYMVLMNKLKHELSEYTNVHQSDIRREREERAAMEMKLLKEISESNDKNIVYETKVEDLERKCRHQQDQIFELKEQVTQLHAELKMKGTQFDEHLSQERARTKNSLQEADQLKLKEIMFVKQEATETEKALRDRIQRLEMTRLELEEEISRQKTVNMTDKLHAEEQINITKQKIKYEEENRMKQLEEKLRMMQIAKDEMESQYIQNQSLVSELNSKNSSLTLEVESLKRRLNTLNEELAEKNNITLAEVGKVKLDLQQALNKQEAERMAQKELREKLSEADSKATEQLMKYRDTIESKEREILSLQEKLRAREYELSRVREEELQRAQVLQNAVMNYVSKVPQPSR